MPAAVVSGQATAVLSGAAESNPDRPTSKSATSKSSSSKSSHGTENIGNINKSVTIARQTVCDTMTHAPQSHAPQVSVSSTSSSFENSTLAPLRHHDFSTPASQMFPVPFWGGGGGPAQMYPGAPYFGTPFGFPLQIASSVQMASSEPSILNPLRRPNPNSDFDGNETKKNQRLEIIDT